MDFSCRIDGVTASGTGAEMLAFTTVTNAEHQYDIDLLLFLRVDIFRHSWTIPTAKAEATSAATLESHFNANMNFVKSAAGIFSLALS